MRHFSMGGVPSSATYRVWADDPERFSTHRIATLHHNLYQHPLFQLPELAKLAKELVPFSQCRFMRQDVTPACKIAHDSLHPDGRSIEECFERIEDLNSWLALYNIEVIPRYQALLFEIVDTMRAGIEREQPDIFRVNGFVFITVPPSVTPFHIDRENNLWLQLRGRKTLNVWEPTDRSIVPAEAVEDFIVTQSLRKVCFKEEFRSRSHEFQARPGDGVYFPSTSPHMTSSDTAWTSPGDRVSISVGVTFYTSATRRAARAHQVNRVLRRCGLSPAYPGDSPAVDALKAPAGRLIGAARAAIVRRVGAAARFKLPTAPPPGSY
ncbi:cupin [Variovorax paradoxus]|nr:cupin [Variovorax paradoxus]